MKKLMIAAAIVCAAAFAQAASMSWSVGAKALPSSSGSGYQMGEKAYFLYLGASDTSTTLYNALKSGTMTVANAISTYSVDNATSTATAAKQAGSIAAREVTEIEKMKTAWKDVNPGDTGYWALLVQDGDKFILSSAASKDFYLTGDTQYGDKQTVTFIAANFSTSANTRTGWTTTAAPEPTSGLLLLLGMGALALRRKRA